MVRRRGAVVVAGARPTTQPNPSRHYDSDAMMGQPFDQLIIQSAVQTVLIIGKHEDTES